MSQAGDSSSRVVVGVDVRYGSPESSTPPHYSVVVLRGEEVVSEYEDVSIGRLIRILWDTLPKIIAVDNVYELAPSKSKLFNLLSLLPPDVEIVQVTGVGGERLNVKLLAKNLDIEVYNKPQPLQTAYIVALAAQKGFGYRVRLIEDKSKVIVSRGRSSSKGGMSHDRYVRNARAGILRVTKEIKSTLDSNNIDYDLLITRSSGGLSRSMFIVYAPRSKVLKLVKPIKMHNIKVDVRPVYSSKIVFEPLNASEKPQVSTKPLIIGLDPGTWTGLAVLDLNGVPLLVKSSKDLDRAEILLLLTQFGRPVIVATDVASPPESVKKLAAVFKAVLYSPSRDLSNDEKDLLLESLRSNYPWIKISDSHERDALASAYKAFLSYADKFEQVDAYVSKFNIQLDVDRVKEAVIHGKTIAEAMEEELERAISLKDLVETEVSDRTEIHNHRSSENKALKKLQLRLRALEAEKASLQAETRALTSEIERLEVELRNLRQVINPVDEYERQINLLREENKSLRKKISQLEEALNSLEKDYVQLQKLLERALVEGFKVIPRVSNVTVESIKSIDFKPSGVVKAIYTDSSINDNVVELMKSSRIAIVTSMPELYLNARIPVIDLRKYEHYCIGSLVIVEPLVEALIDSEWRKIVESEERERRSAILKILEEYRAERAKSIGLSEDLESKRAIRTKI